MCRLLPPITVALSLILLPVALRAQSDGLRLTRMSADDGFSQVQINRVMQDATGFLWVGTVDGLARYDGHRFTFFRQSKDPASLAHNDVRDLAQTSDGVLWIATWGGGLDRLDRFGAGFMHHQHDPDNLQSLANDSIFALAVNAEDVLWIGTRGGGLDRFDPRTGVFVHYRHDPDDPGTLSHDSIEDLFIDSSGTLSPWGDQGGETLSPWGERGGRTLWVASHGGLDRIDTQTGLISRYDSVSLCPGKVLTVTASSSATLWVGTEAGLDELDPATGEVRHHRHRPGAREESGGREDTVIALYDDGAGSVWVGTEGAGLGRYVPASGAHAGFRHRYYDPFSLASDRIGHLFADRSGLLWIATSKGLHKLAPQAMAFGLHRPDPLDRESLSSAYVSALHQSSDGVVWAGTRRGLDAFDRRAGRTLHHRHADSDPDSLGNDYVTAILEDHRGALWVGFPGSGLDRFDRAEGRFIHYRRDPGDPSSLGGEDILVLHEDAVGTLWIGTWGDGLDALDRDRESFRHYRHDPEDPASLAGKYVFALASGADGELWIGTEKSGVDQLDPVSGTLRHFVFPPTGHSNDRVFAIHPGEDGILWLGTGGGGLNRFDPRSGAIRLYTTSDGLPDSCVYGLLPDDDGGLWLSTNHGLARFDPATESVRGYVASDGLQAESFNLHSSFRGLGGELFFGGTDGFNAFFPRRINSNVYRPPVVMTSFRIANRDASEGRDLMALEEIVLGPDDDFVSFGFAALDFTAPSKNRYSYQLLGLDPTWVDLGTHHEVSFTDLRTGEYDLRVRGSNNHGQWNDDASTLRIRIKVLPPPWKTWWAGVLYILALTAVVLGYVRSHRKELRREQVAAEHERAVSRRLREVDKLKDQFLANTSHELRTPLYGITGLAESLIDGATGELPETTKANLAMVAVSSRRLTTLVNDILDFSKLKQHGPQIDLKPVDLHTLVDMVLVLLRPLVGTKDLELENAIAPDLPLVLGDEDRLQQIFHNLVGNAIKFTEVGKVEVMVTAEGDRLVVSVRDTGIGIPEDQQELVFDAFAQVDGSTERELGGTGLGLASSRQLVQLHGGTLRLESTPGEGSTFFFDLPTAEEDMPAEDLSAEDLSAEDVSAEDVPSGQSVAQLMARPSIEPVSKRGSTNVLVVDDELINRQVLVNQLAAEGYIVTQAASGTEALGQIEEHPPDLVLLDVMMPRMSGYEVCKIIRRAHPVEKLPILFLSAKDQSDDRIAGLDHGGNDYLSKPVTKGELLSRVNTHLELLKAHRQQEKEVVSLRGLLPICVRCKQIRNDEGLWNQIEAYISERSEAEFSHGVCPTCMEELYPGLLESEGLE